MKVFKLKSEMLSYLDIHRKKNSIGFVPTMGTLHGGHLSLIKNSKKKCNITICSIFINPIQFNNPQDYISYPNNLESDLEKLKKINCDIVFIPKINEIYNNGEKAKEFDFGTLSIVMEGEFRPGHFNGVATVIEKFFNIIKPTKAFFGQKDLQQLQIVKRLVQQMNSPIEIQGMPTARQKNGLAKSSRNKMLSESAKNEAAIIYHSLKYCFNNKENGISALKSYIKNQFKKQHNIKLEYVEFVDLNTMLPIKSWKKENQNAICIAAYIHGVRLIDNIIL